MVVRKNADSKFDPEMSVLEAQTSRLNTNGSDDEEEDEDADYEESALPPSILRRVVALKLLQDQSDEIDTEYKKERILLETKFRHKKLPLLASRDKIISGETDVPKSSTDESPEEEADEADVAVGIPGYWAQCLVNHPAIEDICTHEDLPAMEAITNITCDYNEDYTSFTLCFFFAENPYFTNEVLKKTYTVSPDLLDEKSPTLTGHATSEIDWKPSQNLCMIETKKKQKSKSGKNKGQTRTVTQQEPKQSFFQYFSEPIEDDEEEEEDEEEERIRIKLTVEEDYDIGHCIRTAVVSESILWFTGEANADEDDEDMDGDDLEDADEDDDDDDEGATGVVGTASGGFASAPGAPGATGKEPECKQN